MNLANRLMRKNSGIFKTEDALHSDVSAIIDLLLNRS